MFSGYHCNYRRNAGEKSAVPLRLSVPKITISLPPGEEGEGGCGWAPGEEGEGGYGWAPEIPFVDLTESERQLERNVSLDFDICFLYTYTYIHSIYIYIYTFYIHISGNVFIT